MLNLLKTHFGLERFLPWQEEIIRGGLAKQDALGLMPTGGGRRGAFPACGLRAFYEKTANRRPCQLAASLW